MWKTGGPDASEMTTPQRARTSRPKHSDTIRFLVNGGQNGQYDTIHVHQKTFKITFSAE